MSEPDGPRWLDEVAHELRAEVPVRAAWRARLIEDVARSPRPIAGEASEASTMIDDDRADGADGADVIPIPARIERRIVMRPLTSVAAALLFAALVAGATLGILSVRTRGDSPRARVAANQSAAQSVTAVTVADAATSEREVVQFELSAPTATHVTLVGSFNRWNPVATPLERDPATGKWVVSVRLPAGRHVYAFVVDGDVTADPTAPRAADADFGSANSVVLVAGQAS